MALLAWCIREQKECWLGMCLFYEQEASEAATVSSTCLSVDVWRVLRRVVLCLNDWTSVSAVEARRRFSSLPDLFYVVFLYAFLDVSMDVERRALCVFAIETHGCCRALQENICCRAVYFHSTHRALLTGHLVCRRFQCVHAKDESEQLGRRANAAVERRCTQEGRLVCVERSTWGHLRTI